MNLPSLIVRVRRRWFATVLLRHAGRAFALASLPVCAAVTVDYALAPEGRALVLLAAITTVLALGLAGLVLWRMQRRPDDRHVARFIEERVGRARDGASLDDVLVSAVDVVERPGATSFAQLIVAAAAERLRGVEPGQIIPGDALRRAAAQAAGGAAVLIVALVLGAPPLARAVDTAQVRLFPESIAVEVLPGDARIPAGTPLRIRAVVRGGSGAISRVPPSLTVAANDDERTVRMTPNGDAFEFLFEAVDRTFSYRVAAGAAVSSAYTVTAVFAPRVRQIDLRYVYPPFTRLPVRDEEDSGDIYGPAGTRVRVRIHTDSAAAEGALAMGRAGAPALVLRPAGERLLEAELLLTADGSYRVALSNADGLRSNGDTEYFIRLMDDRPPDVRILRPSSDQSITPLEEVSIEARADDDYGIDRFDLVYAVSGGTEVVVPFDRVSGTNIQKIGARVLAAEDLGVRPGDVIAYYARARDIGRGKRASETRSDMFFLEVKPFSEEFVQAQSQAGGAGGSAQIDSLITAQKEIISATWNIERRSKEGMSADDLRQVAAAQAELKQRVEQMAERSRRGRGRIRPPAERPAPQRPTAQRPASPDPIAAAAEAMGRAQQQLEARDTRGAIPHEMAALNGLLAAQAEVRRREVSRQANNAGGAGSNRSGQDLSALFDKELQRQQRTNYESRSQADERADRPHTNDSAADRIRDLARRQEELSRQQRDLAGGGLSAEELKRQLERLTREQIDLRERAEELGRQMAERQQEGQQGQQSQPGQPGQRGSQPQGQQAGQRQGQASPSGGGRDMRDVSEQMRSASGDLQRDDPAAAAEKAGRAAEQLRRIEQQMRGSGADAQQKAAGELQVEAQQIAHEQRRIAAEAERLDKGQGSATAPARRRLADDKDRLAGRVEELQRTAREQEPRGGAGGDAARAAADELERQQLGRRMRDSAQQLRASGADPSAPGSTSKPAAEAERQMARALEAVVEKLGGAVSADARQLSEQLEQTQAIRERLNRLEQQLRDAEAQQGAAGGGQRGREGQPEGRGSAGQTGQNDRQRLQQEYQRELARAREALGRAGDGVRPDGGGGATPEQHEFSRSAPGTDASRQDRSSWESLRTDIDSALEQREAAASQRLARKLAEDTLSAGGSDRIPEAYRRQVARYYESLAKVKK